MLLTRATEGVLALWASYLLGLAPIIRYPDACEVGAVVSGWPLNRQQQREDGRVAGWALGRPSHAPNRPVPRCARCCTSQAWITEMDALSPIQIRGYIGQVTKGKGTWVLQPMVTRRAKEPAWYTTGHRRTCKKASGSSNKRKGTGGTPEGTENGSVPHLPHNYVPYQGELRGLG